MKSMIHIFYFLILLFISPAHSSDCKNAFNDETSYVHIALESQLREKQRIAVIDRSNGNTVDIYKTDYNDRRLYKHIILPAKTGEELVIVDQETGEILATFKKPIYSRRKLYDVVLKSQPGEDQRTAVIDRRTGYKVTILRKANQEASQSDTRVHELEPEYTVGNLVEDSIIWAVF